MMNIEFDKQGYVFTRESGEQIGFSAIEISFISHWVERDGWSIGFDAEIDSNEESLDLTNISKEKLIDLCMDEIESKWENCTLDNYCPNYEDILFDVAQENGIWRDLA